MYLFDFVFNINNDFWQKVGKTLRNLKAFKSNKKYENQRKWQTNVMFLPKMNKINVKSSLFP